jgi:hypothetical protein
MNSNAQFWDFMDTGKNTTKSSKNTKKNGEGMFSGGNIGNTLQGIGSISSTIASVYGMKETNKFNDKMLSMEETRVSDAKALQAKKQAAYDDVWAT